MAKRIVVPLDQSSVAEAIVPFIADAARGGGATVRLIHVSPVPGIKVSKKGRVIAYADQEMERLESEGMDYLRTVQATVDGVPVEAVVRFGEPVEEILREAEAFGADLIAMTTTGRSAISRLAFGSVAQQVFRKAGIQVILHRAGEGGVASPA